MHRKSFTCKFEQRNSFMHMEKLCHYLFIIYIIFYNCACNNLACDIIISFNHNIN